jgi:peptide-methionine (S)-S-oxide reductase
VFQALKGVHAVRQGFITADPPHEDWSEAVELDYDPDIISLADLIAAHLATHASSSNHKMRGKYRSAVYVAGADQAALARTAITDAARRTGLDFVTQVLHNRGFKPSATAFQNYYATDPERPFCQTYIDPKLAKLKAQFTTLLRA